METKVANLKHTLNGKINKLDIIIRYYQQYVTTYKKAIDLCDKISHHIDNGVEIDPSIKYLFELQLANLQKADEKLLQCQPSYKNDESFIDWLTSFILP